MEKTFKDYFSTRSDDYANYRPSYPRALVEALVKLCPQNDLALDCGCGTGQLSVLLAERFKKVIATDASGKQKENALPCERITYRVATAENSLLPESSVDIVTVAQAAHWLDLDRFYAEAKRISKPGGVLALITYGISSVDDGEIDKITQHFYRDVLDPYWPPERKHVESGYRTLPFPFREVEFPQLTMESDWNLHELFGYISTWSAVKELERISGSAEIYELKNKLASAWGDLEIKRKITWPLSVRVGCVNNS